MAAPIEIPKPLSSWEPARSGGATRRSVSTRWPFEMLEEGLGAAGRLVAEEALERMP